MQSDQAAAVTDQSGGGNRSLFCPDSAEDAFMRAVHAPCGAGASWAALLSEALGGSDMTCVVAGVVLSRPANSAAEHADVRSAAREYLCVSLGSGTRCVGISPKDEAQYRSQDGLSLSSLIVRDGHAEVMARRGFVAFLLDGATQLLSCTEEAASVHPFLERKVCHCVGRTTGDDVTCCSPDAATRGFVLRDSVKAHLVCTHWPCGALGLAASGTTGAKIIVETPTRRLLLPDGLSWEAVTQPNCVAHVDGHVLAAHRSVLDQDAVLAPIATRVKPGKGHGNLNMSCTDKVWRWSALGLQGHRRLPLFPQPMRLSSLHVVQQRPPSPPLGHAPVSMEACRAVVAARNNGFRAAQSQLTHPGAADLSLELHLSCASSADTEPVPEHTDSNATDSRYSRSAWVQLVTWSVPTPSVAVVGTKRGRNEGEPTPTLSAAHDSTSGRLWRPTWSPSNGVTVNTKAGLPQGSSLSQLQSGLTAVRRRQQDLSAPPGTSEGHMSGGGGDGGGDGDCTTAARRALAVVDSFVSKYVLSRAWFGVRVLTILLSRDASDLGPTTPRVVERSLCRQTFDQMMQTSLSAAEKDPAGWFFSAALPYLDDFLLSGRESRVREDESPDAQPCAFGGSVPHHLYRTASARDVGEKGQKPEQTLLWVEKRQRARQ